LKAKASSIRLLDKTGKILESVASWGLSRKYLQKGLVALDKSPLDRAVLKGRIVQIRSMSTDKRIQYRAEAKREGIASLLCVPLKVRGSMMGVLRIYTDKEHTFSPDEIVLIETFAAQGAVVIKNSRRYGRLKTLSEIGRRIASQLDIESILTMICEHATQDMSAKGASIMLINRDTGRLEVVATHGLSGRFTEKGPVIVDKSVCECLGGKEVVIEDTSRDKRLQYPRALKSEGIKSLICIPLKLKGGMVGTLRVYIGYRYVYDREDLEFLNILGDFGVVALENARLYEHTKRAYEDLTEDVWKWYGWGTRHPKL
jgi:GAF domain-containing protein